MMINGALPVAGVPADAQGSATSELSLNMPARLEEIDRTVEAVRPHVAPVLASGALFGVLTALREALLNAATHGCGLDPARNVRLTVRAEGPSLRFRVTDPGPGFDWRGRCAEPPGVESSSGRGLCLMTHYCDAVEFNETGNAVTLTTLLPEPGTRENRQDDAMNEQETGDLTVAPGGDIVASMAQAFKERLAQTTAASPAGLCIDLAEVRQIDSVGLGVLIAAHNTLASRGRRLVLRNVSKDIMKLLKAMRLDKHFQICSEDS